MKYCPKCTMMYHEDKCPSMGCQMTPDLTDDELGQLKEITELRQLCNQQIEQAAYWREKYIEATGCKIVMPPC